MDTLILNTQKIHSLFNWCSNLVYMLRCVESVLHISQRIIPV